MLSFELRHVARLPCFQLVSLRGFRYSGGANRGFEEFFEVTKPNEVKTFGRAWTAEDLRRKSFDDLHGLWFVLYKERNLLLTMKHRARRNQRPVTAAEESRYSKVKKSMAGIKHVLGERKKIKSLLEESNSSI